MFRLLKKKKVAGPLAVVTGLVVAAGAFAYFTSTGSGTGTASVGSASNWTVTPSAAIGQTMYPGSGTATVPYTVTNPSSGHQQLNATGAVVASYSGAITADTGDVTQNGNPVAGCLASWFAIGLNQTPGSLPKDLAGGAVASGGFVTVQMFDANANQNPCQGATPDITISAS